MQQQALKSSHIPTKKKKKRHATPHPSILGMFAFLLGDAAAWVP